MIALDLPFWPPVPVQNYITAIIVFLIVEELMTWGFYGKVPPTS